jgi:transcriptional regulator with XRE-family HTH domain
MKRVTHAHLGIVVRRRRERLGLTCREVAQAIGIKSPGFISMIEAGHEIPPTRAPALARVMGWDEKQLVHFVLRATYPELGPWLLDPVQEARSGG